MFAAFLKAACACYFQRRFVLWLYLLPALQLHVIVCMIALSTA
jgi:hypothetical protein